MAPFTFCTKTLAGYQFTWLDLNLEKEDDWLAEDQSEKPMAVSVTTTNIPADVQTAEFLPVFP